MKIAVIGWGSLIPVPGELAIAANQEWYLDGPLLPIEYARISNGKKLTLVINEGSEITPTLWTLMSMVDLEEAKENLRVREGMLSTIQIGYVESANSRSDNFSSLQLVERIREWARSKELDAVIWTGLQPNFENKISELFNEQERELNIENVEWFLSKLSSDEYKSAKDYIINTPGSTITPLRSFIENLFNRKT